MKLEFTINCTFQGTQFEGDFVTYKVGTIKQDQITPSDHRLFGNMTFRVLRLDHHSMIKSLLINTAWLNW